MFIYIYIYVTDQTQIRFNGVALPSRGRLGRLPGVSLGRHLCDLALPHGSGVRGRGGSLALFSVFPVSVFLITFLTQVSNLTLHALMYHCALMHHWRHAPHFLLFVHISYVMYMFIYMT